METRIDKRISWPLPISGALLAAGASGLYWGVARLLALLPGEPLGLELRPLKLGLSALAYVVFAHDYAALFAAHRDRYEGHDHRAALQAGAQTGTLMLKIIMMVLWYALSQAPLLIGLMLLFAVTQLLAVAQLSVAEAAGAPGRTGAAARLFRALLVVPNRLIAPLTRQTIHPLDLGIEAGLSPRALFHRARAMPRLTMHDMVVFVPLYRELGIVEFGVGALLGNLVVNALMLVRPAPVLRALRHPASAVVRCALFLALAGTCGVRLVDVVRAALVAQR
ncbi:MAG: hypothetical protein ABI134_30035 [Byssovorax sp.]